MGKLSDDKDRLKEILKKFRNPFSSEDEDDEKEEKKKDDITKPKRTKKLGKQPEGRSSKSLLKKLKKLRKQDDE